MNYSTAKTILRIFRIEKRLEKKKTHKDIALKRLLIEYKNENKKEDSTEKEIIDDEDNQGLLEPDNIKEIEEDSESKMPLTKDEKTIIPKESIEQRVDLLEKNIGAFSEIFNDFQEKLNQCIDVVKVNQMNINLILSLMESSNKEKNTNDQIQPTTAAANTMLNNFPNPYYYNNCHNLRTNYDSYR